MYISLNFWGIPIQMLLHAGFDHQCDFVMHKWVVAFYGTLCGFRLRSTCGTIWKRFIWLYEILERKIRHMKHNTYHKNPSYGNFIKRHLKTETIQFVYELRICSCFKKNLLFFTLTHFVFPTLFKILVFRGVFLFCFWEQV